MRAAVELVTVGRRVICDLEGIIFGYSYSRAFSSYRALAKRARCVTTYKRVDTAKRHNRRADVRQACLNLRDIVHVVAAQIPTPHRV